jgi:hypothetical protein
MINFLQQTASKLAGYKRVLQNKAGSPTVEYVILIGVGALVAGLLAAALSGDNNTDIIKTISNKIKAIIEAATTFQGDKNT